MILARRPSGFYRERFALETTMRLAILARGQCAAFCAPESNDVLTFAVVLGLIAFVAGAGLLLLIHREARRANDIAEQQRKEIAWEVSEARRALVERLSLLPTERQLCALALVSLAQLRASASPPRGDARHLDLPALRPLPPNVDVPKVPVCTP